MSCGGFLSKITCIEWKHYFTQSMNLMFKANNTNAHLNLEREVGKMKSGTEICLDENTGFNRAPIDEFCASVKQMKDNGQITDTRTWQAIDTFCKTENTK